MVSSVSTGASAAFAAVITAEYTAPSEQRGAAAAGGGARPSLQGHQVARGTRNELLPKRQQQQRRRRRRRRVGSCPRAGCARTDTGRGERGDPDRPGQAALRPDMKVDVVRVEVVRDVRGLAGPAISNGNPTAIQLVRKSPRWLVTRRRGKSSRRAGPADPAGSCGPAAGGRFGVTRP